MKGVDVYCKLGFVKGGKMVIVFVCDLDGYVIEFI